MDLNLAALFLFVCHTIAINIVQFRHRNDEVSPIKPKRKMVIVGADMPIYLQGRDRFELCGHERKICLTAIVTSQLL